MAAPAWLYAAPTNAAVWLGFRTPARVWPVHARAGPRPNQGGTRIRVAGADRDATGRCALYHRRILWIVARTASMRDAWDHSIGLSRMVLARSARHWSAALSHSVSARL